MWVVEADDSLSSVTRYVSPVVCFSCTLEIVGSQWDDDIILLKTRRRLYELVSARLNVYGSGFLWALNCKVGFNVVITLLEQNVIRFWIDCNYNTLK